MDETNRDDAPTAVGALDYARPGMRPKQSLPADAVVNIVWLFFGVPFTALLILVVLESDAPAAAVPRRFMLAGLWLNLVCHIGLIIATVLLTVGSPAAIRAHRAYAGAKLVIIAAIGAAALVGQAYSRPGDDTEFVSFLVLCGGILGAGHALLLLVVLRVER